MTATIYGQTIEAKSMSDLKRKASMIANRFCNTIDYMYVKGDFGIITMSRINKVPPWNTITYGGGGV